MKLRPYIYKDSIMKPLKKICYLPVILIFLVLSLFINSELVFAEDAALTEFDSAGHESAPLSALDLTKEDKQKLAADKGKYKAAIVMHYPSDWTDLQIMGMKNVFDQYGVKSVVIKSAEFSVSDQILNIDRAISEKPDVILSIPVNESIQGPAYKKISKNGIKLILLDMIPKGLKYPEHYSCLVSASNRKIGSDAADIMAEHLGGKGKVGILELAFPFYVTEQKTYGFEQRLKEKYPEIKVVGRARFGGETVDMKEATQKTEELLLGNIGLNGMFAVWMEPAMAAVKAVQTLGKTPKNFVITTSDLEEAGAIEIARGGFIKGIGAEDPYIQGQTEAKAAIRAMLGHKNPPYVAVPTPKITKKNLLEEYVNLFHKEPPAKLKKAMTE